MRRLRRVASHVHEQRHSSPQPTNGPTRPTYQAAAAAAAVSFDPYAVLGIERGSSQSEIRKAYRKLAVQHHPDKGGDTEKFKEVAEAYALLSDTEKRAEYDRYGHAGAQSAGRPFRGGWSSAGSSFDFRNGVDAHRLFEELFGARMGPGSVSGFGFREGGETRRKRSGWAGVMQGRHDMLDPGTSVMVRGLQRAGHHNGCEGIVQGCDAKRERMVVKLTGNNVQLLVRAINVQPLFHATVHGLVSRPQLNHQRLRVTGYDELRARFLVQMPDGRPASLAPGNVRLPVGTRVQVVGLSTAQVLNGRWGRVHAPFDAVAERYIVNVMAKDRAVKIKPANLRT
jgi:hypothetical protein